MITGGWNEAFYMDQRADTTQREALEAIFAGTAGGPWGVLSRFVSKRYPTQFVSLRFEDDGRRKRMCADELLDTSVEAIRGKNKSKDAVMTNVFNQIHTADQVLALGQTRCAHPEFKFTTEESHALYSRFAWEVT